MKNKWNAILALMVFAGAANAAYVTIGDAGNDADTTGYGAVSYTYKISDVEVSSAEFSESGAGDGNEGDADDNTPAHNVTLYEAMKYCNWLTSGNVNNGAYIFNAGTYQSTDRASALSSYGTLYALPTEDEWYKAAYYDASGSGGYSLYADGTDTLPLDTVSSDNTGWNYIGDNTAQIPAWNVGSSMQEQNGTYDMMGNVYEWMEDSSGVRRGGAYSKDGAPLASSNRSSYSPTTESWAVGLRTVQIVPEPATGSLVALVGLFGFLIRRHFIS